MPLPTRRPGLVHRGFTLIELMIVVAIVGLLASVAIPQFQLMSQRARRAERDTMLTSLARALNAHWIEHGKFPGGGAMVLAPNPPHPPDGTRQPFDPSVPGWNTFGWSPDGLLYFRYDVWATFAANSGTMRLTASSDLDQDGAPSIKTVTFTIQDGTWQRIEEAELGDDF